MSIRVGYRIPDKKLLINLTTKGILNFSDILNFSTGGIYDYSPKRRCGSLDFPADDDMKEYSMRYYNSKLGKFVVGTKNYIYFWDLSKIEEKLPYQRCKRPSAPCLNLAYLDNECLILLEDESWEDVYVPYIYKTNFAEQRLELIAKIDNQYDNMSANGNQIILSDENGTFLSLFEFDERQRLISNNIISVEYPDQLLDQMCTSDFQVVLSNFQVQIRCKLDNSVIQANNVVGSASSIFHFKSFHQDNADIIVIANDYGPKDEAHFEEMDEFWDNYTSLNIYQVDLSKKLIVQIDQEVDYWENNDQFRIAKQIVHYPTHDFLILQRDTIEIWNLFPVFKIWSANQRFHILEPIMINNKLEVTGITNGVQQTTIFLAPCIFANLIASELFELNEEGIFASFLQKDLYDPRLLLLIWAFVYEPRFVSGDRQINEISSDDDSDSLDEDED